MVGQVVTNGPGHAKYCIKDSSVFVNYIQNFPLSKMSSCLFDIRNLFTYVVLHKIIDIYADALYHSCLPPSYISETVELIKLATISIEFSFNHTMYRQIDKIVMCSPLGPAIANIFLGFYE